VLILLACNAPERGGGPVSGSAGLSGGDSAGTSAGETEGPGAESGGDSTGENPVGTTGEGGDDATSTSGIGDTTGAADEGSTGDSGGLDTDGSSETTGDLADGVLDIVITAHNDCTFTTNPASITVPEGTAFTVNWVSSAASEVEFDVAKIDAFNAVPIILGMEPGTSYHDDIREWCGNRFTGTFDFRVTSCFDHHYIPVDCGG
jgi:hypothetical protein